MSDVDVAMRAVIGPLLALAISTLRRCWQQFTGCIGSEEQFTVTQPGKSTVSYFRKFENP
ncbi:MAG: hypothetical protein AB7G75_29730 [Candidatus Binatia bacterium]